MTPGFLCTADVYSLNKAESGMQYHINSKLRPLSDKVLVYLLSGTGVLAGDAFWSLPQTDETMDNSYASFF